MVLYTCQRCGYQNKIKTHFIKHLNRKKQCPLLLSGDHLSSPELESYIIVKNNEKVVDIKKKSFVSKSKLDDLSDYPKSYEKNVTNGSQIDFEVKQMTSKLSQSHEKLCGENFKPKSNAKVIQKNGQNGQESMVHGPSLDFLTDPGQNLVDFTNLRPIKNSEGRFECPYCGVAYGRKNNCVQHLKNKCKVRNSELINHFFVTNNDNESEKKIIEKMTPKKNVKKVISKKSSLETMEEKLYKDTVSSEIVDFDDITFPSCEKSYIPDHSEKNIKSQLTIRPEDEESIHIAKMESEMLKKENDELRKQIEILISKVGNTTVNLQQNIIINSIGNEDISYINNKMINNLVASPYIALPKLIKNIHFHPEHPENHNIRITNKKEKFIKVFKNNKWQLEDKKQVIDNMVDKGKSILDEHRDKQLHSEFKNQCYDHFSEKFENDDKDLKKKINTDVELVILNNTD
tara:strand:- start:445 stop:1821 length:1377 start_codon:yes stop_codon:yes gene_type:complete